MRHYDHGKYIESSSYLAEKIGIANVAFFLYTRMREREREKDRSECRTAPQGSPLYQWGFTELECLATRGGTRVYDCDSDSAVGASREMGGQAI